ncbi:MAG: hypothetical protein ACT4OW_04140 [Nitrososphaerota archaeon]
MKIRGIAIDKIWTAIEKYGIDRKKLESNNLDDDSLYFLYLIAKNHNDRQKSKQRVVAV